ncbi:xanthine dehydrogenase family protein molybdopterin-binding subunit [Pontibacter anaerobius]|uniref:Xanthine dehydrogenase family protein molybdopterin-binding subunit n=1 Tax=Pontibacter anaerobius TaxID=2993940 RepID=A0ABT3RGR8_9BACT|nr:xanthine dehydrogenase family protein molybdopterin-binding subunit [Pontibacter anaerobius]MCX2740960.1 xanthine dehydrogenase family protein molybdopterin-binding subunit [Pontibacter anaerobius]
MKNEQIGKATSRVDGRAKVTGEAKYAAEFNVPDLTYGFVVSSAIARGKIKSIDTSKALAVNGVLQVFTHENRPGYVWGDEKYQDKDSPPGSPFRPLYQSEIQFSMQPIALVVAETFELARYGASLVEVAYKQDAFDTNFEANIEKAYVPEKYKSTPPPDPRGKPEKAFADAALQIETEYTHPSEHHNPMEMHASVAVWEKDGKLTVYDKIQGVDNSQQYIANAFGMDKEEVRVISPFVGGAFGSGLRPQYQLFLAVLAARELKRSVKVMLTRQQMFSFGHRPKTTQRLAVGAAEDGKLEAIQHDAFAETSKFEDYSENVITWPGVLYKCDNMKLSHKLVGLDVYTPLDMRAPGGTTGIFALECTMDELAYKAGVDPVEFRLKNYSEKDQNQDKPFSSKELKECYRQGAEKFGWSKRNPEPRSMKEGHNLIGWGMAHGAWEATQKEASAKAVLSPDGKLTVSSATADIGTGTYTVMTQIAADTLGLPLQDVTFLLGDTSLPKSPLEGGSWTVSSVGSAVKAACDKVREKLFKLAQQVENSPLKDAKFEEVRFTDGKISLQQDASKAVTITAALKQNGGESIEEQVDSKPADKQDNYAPYTHAATFVEVKVDEDLGTVKVTRIVSAIAGGRVINPKTARSQILGGMVWGIGVALEEEAVMDNNLGRFMNHDLDKYHVPVNADVHDMEVIFVEEKDDIVNPLGAKGLGEIGIVSVAPAIVNAIFHATGKRVRELPVTLDKLL